jgi:hypothetical protein
VTVSYTCADSVGNATEHTYRFRVTEDAPRRGPNIGYYNQSLYMPPEEPAAVAAPVRKRSRHWWWAAGVGVVAVGGGLAWRRRGAVVRS